MVKKIKLLATGKGFTLIEVLVVMLISGILLGAVVMGVNRYRKINQIVMQLEQDIVAARQQAILMPQTLELKLTHSGYQFYSNDQPLLNDRLSHLQVFPRRIKLEMKPETIIFSQSGDVTPFNLIIGEYQLSMNDAGDLNLTRQD